PAPLQDLAEAEASPTIGLMFQVDRHEHLLVNKLGDNPFRTIKLPNAVASARGTMFDVSYHEGQPPPATP
ncbi:MAG: hypothetical protein WB580_03655, partial [Candidatus Binataceae bacterium]